MPLFSPLLAALEHNAVALDIGAHVGAVARLLAAHLERGRVYAFEPSPSTFELLQKNAAFAPNIECIPCALSEVTGSLGFQDAAPSGLRRLASEADGNGPGIISVPVTRLDDWARQQQLTRIDLIKLDVEGFEEEVLVGAQQVIAQHRPAIVFELIPTLAAERSRYRGQQLLPWLREAGHAIFRVDADGTLRADLASTPQSTNDYLAVLPGSALYNTARALAK
jgi:FkbM family methyltransferase